jgi:uncharacterized protein YdeI (YjbR/CyaY-like superfamily)
MLTLNSIDCSLEKRRSAPWKATPIPAGLKRKIHPIPDVVAEALKAHGLSEAYGARPACQQNDYVGWISRAKRHDTRYKQQLRMLDELQAGNVYMNMKWNG